MVQLRGRLVSLACLVAAGLLLGPGTARAQVYSQLQVLLPGESAAPGTVTGKLGTPTAQTVGVPFTVSVRACDATWHTVSSVTNIVQLTSTDASATLPGPASLSGGQRSFTVTLNAAGSFHITADDQTDTTIPDAQSASVTSMSLEGFAFSPIAKHQYVGAPISLTLTAVDATGLRVSGFTGTVRLKELTSYGDGRISPEEITLNAGQWSGSVTVYRADETSISHGSVNVYAYLPTDPAKNGSSVPFIVHPGVLSRLQIIVPGQSPLPGSVSGVTGTPASQAAGSSFAVDVYGTDNYWNVVPNMDMVRISSTDPLASPPVSGPLSQGHGQFTFSLGTTGTQTVTVRDLTNPSITQMTSPPITVGASAPHHFVIDPIASPITAGESVAVTIHATDASGNPVPDYSGNAILSAITGPGSISPEAIIFSGGLWSGPVVFRGAGGAVTISCFDFASPPHVGTSASFQILPGPFAGLQVLLPGETPQGGTSTGFSGTPVQQHAGTPFNITVRAVDAYWNRVTGITDRVALSSTDPFAGIPADTVVVNGELILSGTLFKAGQQTISAASVDSTGIAPYTSSHVAVVGGAYSRILIVAPGETIAPGTATGRSGAATDQSITFSFRTDIYATDNWWNPVPGVSDVIRLSSSDPMAQIPADSAMTDGHVALSVRLSAGGFQTITATNVTQPGITPSTTQVRMISSGFHLVALVAPTRVRAGEPFELTVRVTNDAGSVIEEINSSVDIEVQHAVTRAPGRGELALSHFQLLGGERTVPETYTFAEPIILIVRDDAGNEPAVSEVVTIDPGFPAAVRLASDPTWVRGNRHATVTARVVDTYENSIPDQPVQFATLSGAGTLTPTDSLTQADGAARADFLAARTPGITQIRATSGAFMAQLDLQTALVDPTAAGGSVTSYPNPFHPDEGPGTIAYKLDDNATVHLDIYTLSGNLVLTREFPAGTTGGLVGLNEFLWDGRNGKGKPVASGGYIVHILAQGAGETLHEMRRHVAVVR